VLSGANGAYAQAMGFIKSKGVVVGVPEGEPLAMGGAYPFVNASRQVRIIV